MAIEAIGLDQIHDNPYQARLSYHRQDIDDLAHSIKTHGLLQVPPGRRIDGNVELCFGHLRKRAFIKLSKKEPEKFGKMPVDIRELTDDQMAMFSLEENLKREGLTPLETARAVDHYLNSFLAKTEVELAESLNMSKGTVSNMRRVLRLPEKILEKIDNGTISFTQGRELLIFERFENAENLMTSALGGLRTGNKAFGELNTVEGLQKSIHSVISGQCRPLDEEWQGWRRDLLFDTRAAGCLECDKMVRTHPTKSATAHYCTDEDCWKNKQEEHKEQAAAVAKAKMQAEVLERAAQSIAQEEKAPPPAPVMIDENTVLVDQETFAKIETSYSADKISEGTAVRKPVEFEGKLYLATGGGMGKEEAYQLVPRAEFTGEVRTYRVPAGRESEEYYESLRNDPNGFYHGMLVKRGQVEHVLVGPEVTFVTKVDEGDFSEKSPGQVEAAERDRQMEEARERANLERPVGELPCETCIFGNTCDRSFFHVADDNSGRLICEQWECDHVSWALPKEPAQAVPKDLQDISRRIAAAPAPQEVPDDILTMAKEKAGTRAELLDLIDICTGNEWSRQMKAGYALLSDELRHIDDPEECLERCTHGFHPAFDSKAKEQKEIYVCSDPKCLAKKKGDHTRKRNAAGQALKNAERAAIKQVLDEVDQIVEGSQGGYLTISRPFLELIIYNQLHGKQNYFYGEKEPRKWLWDKLNAGTPQEKRSDVDLWKLIRKLSDADLVKLIVECMFFYLKDHGDTASYEIKTKEPLAFFGITINDAVEEEVVNV